MNVPWARAATSNCIKVLLIAQLFINIAYIVISRSFEARDYRLRLAKMQRLAKFKFLKEQNRFKKHNDAMINEDLEKSNFPSVEQLNTPLNKKEILYKEADVS